MCEYFDMENADVPYDVSRVYLTDPFDFLEWLWSAQGKFIRLGDFDHLEVWAIAAIAAISRYEYDEGCEVEFDTLSRASRFAYSIGLEHVIENMPPDGYQEVGRTVKLRRFDSFESIEPVSDEISRLIIDDNMVGENEYFDAEETRRTIYYVMVELMRNVIQHSRDKLGGVIVAQSMYIGGNYEENPSIQIDVADYGIGVYESLSSMHPDIKTPGAALERSILPHFSGAFPKTKKGFGQNAGLGLFFVSEMIKILGGRMMISSRGASLTLQGDINGLNNNKIDLHDKKYPGTLVVFEIPKRSVADHKGIIRKIQDKAKLMYSNRQSVHHMRFDIPRQEFWEFMVNVATENTSKAESFANRHIIPRLNDGNPVIINFSNVDICTQSFLHALLFDPLQVAYDNKVDIYIKGAAEAVKEGLKFLESYALKID